MNLERLTTFIAAADTMNFTQAARRLHLSQSAVSQQMRELEEDLGVTLFERRGRGLMLTPAGETLRTRGQALLREAAGLRSELTAFRGLAQGVLRLGASNTLGIYLLPYALGRFSLLYPGIRVSLLVTDAGAITTRLRDGELDAALVEEDLSPGVIPGWEKLPLLEDALVLVAGAGHPVLDALPMPREGLLTLPFILRQRESETRRLIHDRLAEAGLDPERLNVRFELGNTEGIKRAVMTGLGVGFVSRYATWLEQRAGWLVEVPVEGLDIRRMLWLVRPQTGRPAHSERFSEMLLSGDWLPR
ncbi:MAG TPA: LysR family transcriptional regulator [Oscillatoriaceae cyanobacterium]